MPPYFPSMSSNFIQMKCNSSHKEEVLEVYIVFFIYLAIDFLFWNQSVGIMLYVG